MRTKQTLGIAVLAVMTACVTVGCIHGETAAETSTLGPEEPPPIIRAHGIQPGVVLGLGTVSSVTRRESGLPLFKVVSEQCNVTFDRVVDAKPTEPASEHALDVGVPTAIRNICAGGADVGAVNGTITMAGATGSRSREQSIRTLGA